MTLHQAPVQCLPLRAAKPGQDTGDARRRTGIYPFVPFLHEVRLGNCLTCQNNVPAEYAEKMLPPLTLQLLVENVIKHNSITPGKPMVITIRIEDEYLSVSNPIHPKKSVASSGIGLENLAKRCELMSGKKIIIKNETEKFTVKVPLLYE